MTSQADVFSEIENFEALPNRSVHVATILGRQTGYDVFRNLHICDGEKFVGNCPKRKS